MASTKPAQHALERLMEGNGRFVEEVDRTVGAARRQAFLSSQRTFAVVLACSDSRVVPELVFDEGFGRLFVVRVAGAIPGPEQLGSIEYAVERFGCRLVVVMGHTQCGAVAAALDDPPDPIELRQIVAESPNLKAITDRIQASFDPLEMRDPRPPAELWREAVRETVVSSVEQVRASSLAIVDAINRAQVVVVGAIYDVETGKVEFLED